MAQLNKLVVASEMFLEAHRRFVNAGRDIDYVASIVLSGAVVGIVGPLLKEQGGRTTHELLAKVANLVSEPGGPPAHEGMFRSIYNGLKHAGNKNQKVRPSEDLEIHTDLRVEAGAMLEAAREDFSKIMIDRHVVDRLSQEFRTVINDNVDYA